MANTPGEHISTFGKVAKIVGSDELTYDPTLGNTSIGESSITFIDGVAGILIHSGYDIHDLALQGSYAETSYLILNGELPTQEQLEEFEQSLVAHRGVPELVFKTLNGFKYDALPMDKLNALTTALGSSYRGTTDPNTKEGRYEFAKTFVAQIPELAAAAYRHSKGWPPIPPRAELTHAQNFYNMCFDELPSPIQEKALDIFFTLHADHEQNASTTAAKVAISTNADPYTAMASAIGALSGPRHGGANMDVIVLLKKIDAGETTVDEVIDRAVKGAPKVKVPGLGHRVYETTDPRADVLRKICHEVLEQTNDEEGKRLFAIAKKIEDRVQGDEYFIKRGIYPNVDFYSGIILKGLGFPPEMFPVLFAVGRSVGWSAQINERLAINPPIMRPMQTYVGEGPRPYVPIHERGLPEPDGDAARAGAEGRVEGNLTPRLEKL